MILLIISIVIKGNDNNFSNDNNFNYNFGIINENKNSIEEEKKEINEINSSHLHNENKIENIDVKIYSFEKRKISRFPLTMADIIMIHKSAQFQIKI